MGFLIGEFLVLVLSGRGNRSGVRLGVPRNGPGNLVAHLFCYHSTLAFFLGNRVEDPKQQIDIQI